MSKSIDLPPLQNTGGIRLDTGEMKTIAVKAIQKETEERSRQALAKRISIAQDMRDRIISYIFSRILQKGEESKLHYDEEFQIKWEEWKLRHESPQNA